MGFNECTVNLIDNMVSGHKIKILSNGTTSPDFEATVGVPQGDPISPLVFNLYFNAITSLNEKYNGVSIGGTKVVMLLYADDVIVMTETQHEMNNILKDMNNIALQLGLHFATTKCKVFGITVSGRRSKTKIFLNNQNINTSSSEPLVYLGARLTNNLI